MSRLNIAWGFFPTSGIVLSNRDLTASTPDDGGNVGTINTSVDHSGVSIYFEVEVDAFSADGSPSATVGIGVLVYDTVGHNIENFYYRSNGDLVDTYSGNTVGWGATYSAGDVIGVAFKNSKVYFAKNGVWQASGDPAAETNPAAALPYAAGNETDGWFYSTSDGDDTVTLRAKASHFRYTVPTGCTALDEIAARTDVSFDPNAITGDAALSNENKTYTTTNVTAAEVDGNTFFDISAEAVYFEMSIDTMGDSGSIYVGVIDDGYSEYVEYGKTGALNTSGGTTDPWGNTFDEGDVIGVAIKNKKVYYSKNNVWQASADPVAETSQAFTFTASRALFYVKTGSGLGHVVTLNAEGRDLSYSPPTGYTPLDEQFSTDESTAETGSPEITGELNVEALSGMTVANVIQRVLETEEVADAITESGETEIGFGMPIGEGMTLGDSPILAIGYLLSDAVSISSELFRVYAFPVIESLSVSSSTSYDWAVSVQEQLEAGDTLAEILQTTMQFNESLTIGDLLKIGLLFNVGDGMELGDSLDPLTHKLLDFSDALLLLGVAESRATAIQAVSEAIVIQAESEYAWAMNLIEALGVTGESTIDQVAQIMALIDGIEIAATAEHTYVVNMVLGDGLEIDDTLTVTQAMVMAIEDGMQLSGVVHLPDGIYQAWVVNTETFAAWQYQNFPFNSFAHWGGRYWGFTETGVYQLEAGADDDGDQIYSAIKTGLTTLGTTLEKNLPQAYFGMSKSGDMLLTTITNEGGHKRQEWYRVYVPTDDGSPHQEYTSLARGVISTYWQFKLENIDGSDFEIDQMKMLPMVLQKRRDG